MGVRVGVQASRQSAHTSTKLLSIMKIHIDIDDAALAGVQTLGSFATKREAVNAALNEFARTLAARKLLEIRGKVSCDGDLAAQRNSRFPGWDQGH